METTIAVKLDDTTAQIMHDYAKKKNKTVSELIEEYAYSISQKKDNTELIDNAYWEEYLEKNMTPRIKKIYGVFKNDDDFDYKDRAIEYLMEKHR